MVERLTITLDKDLLAEVDAIIDSGSVKNRSHAISVLIKKALGASLPKKAVILCGGIGTRFRPITYEIPKALIPVHGKPIVEHLIELFKKYEIKDIILCVGYLKDRIKDYFGDGSRFGTRISYIEEEEALGTAGPIKKAKDMLKEPFFVTNGDELKDVNLADMYFTHRTQKAAITIALTTVQDPSHYGVADLCGSRILRFIEKPPKEEAPSNFISSGLYIIEPHILSMIPDGFSMLEKDVFPKIAAVSQLVGYPFSGQWFDTGNPERYERALKNWKGIY